MYAGRSRPAAGGQVCHLAPRLRHSGTLPRISPAEARQRQETAKTSVLNPNVHHEDHEEKASRTSTGVWVALLPVYFMCFMLFMVKPASMWRAFLRGCGGRGDGYIHQHDGEGSRSTLVRLKIVIVFVVVIESTTMDDNENDNEHSNRECNKVRSSV
jgi:hypothetical protein